MSKALFRLGACIAAVLFLTILLICRLKPPCVEAANSEKAIFFYVSTSGNDQWSGTLPEVSSSGKDGPFASLQRAIDAVRKMKNNGLNAQFTILVRGGIYRLSETLLLGPEDSGTKQHPLIIRAYGKERPILSGSKQIANLVKYKGNIYNADLRGILPEAYGLRQLFAEGKRQILARFPNFDSRDPIGGGFFYVADSVDGGSKIKFKFREDQVFKWANPESLEVVIYPGPNYWNNTILVAAIDREHHIIELRRPASYPIITGNRYYFQNILEELDSPGEWYFDSREKVLYFWPPNEDSLQTVSIPVLQSLLQIGEKKYLDKKGTPAYISIEGLTFQDCEDDAIFIKGSKGVIIAGCTVLNAGGNGITIRDSYESSAIGNDILEVGGIGIYISGGDRKVFTPGRNRAENNYIHHVGVTTKTGSGIECYGVGNVVSQNLIHSTPRLGIWFDGNDHVIEYNLVHHVNQETQDSAAILSCARDWTKRGNIVRFNYIHDTGGYGRNTAKESWQTPFHTYGIYLDDWTSGTQVYGNIIRNAAYGGIFIHGGRDNVIENNIIIDGGSLGQVVYSGWPFTHPNAQQWLPKMYAKVREGDHEKYPRLATIKDIHTGAAMSGNSFLRNIIYYTNRDAPLYGIYNDIDISTTTSDYNIIFHKGSTVLIPYTKKPAQEQWIAWRNLGLDRNSLIVNPLLLDMAKEDFSLSPDSPALQMGFKPIPVERIGPYQDPMRASWPIKESHL